MTTHELKNLGVEKYWCPTKVISGGQTGVDRAGLDAAIAAEIPIGGYCPKGRRSEDGAVPDRYPLVELANSGYKKRTERNVQESDGTLIVNTGTLSGGTLLTMRLAEKHQKPVFILNAEIPDICGVHRWGHENAVRILNIAGPRENKTAGGIYDQAHQLLLELLQPAVEGVTHV
ncbi:MAG: putative molybdenum carrier protein [Desulfuromusa sp.]|nr:putative molybdenum carrier protein [Desulfuromusa sp.]